MLSTFIIAISSITSILWSIVFLLPQYFDYVLYHINGNMLNTFIPNIKTYSYSTNDEPSGWIIGWSEGFYIGYLSTTNGHLNQSPNKNLYIFTSKHFYTNYISNSYIRNKLKASQASNILLIADSCFSGSLLTRGISETNNIANSENIFHRYLNTKSKVVITSGGLQPVLDGGGGANSVFASSFVDSLNNFSKPFTSNDLYIKIRDDVTNKTILINIEQTPLRGELLSDGHEGPDFVFLPN